MLPFNRTELQFLLPLPDERVLLFRNWASASDSPTISLSFWPRPLVVGGDSSLSLPLGEGEGSPGERRPLRRLRVDTPATTSSEVWRVRRGSNSLSTTTKST